MMLTKQKNCSLHSFNSSILSAVTQGKETNVRVLKEGEDSKGQTL